MSLGAVRRVLALGFCASAAAAASGSAEGSAGTCDSPACEEAEAREWPDAHALLQLDVPVGSRVARAAPAGVPGCAGVGEDPMRDQSSPRQCCASLSRCRNAWDGPGGAYFRCFANCSCAGSGHNPYMFESMRGRCCSGLKLCVGTSDESGHEYVQCLVSCPETTTNSGQNQESNYDIIPQMATTSRTSACSAWGVNPYANGGNGICCEGLEQCLGEWDGHSQSPSYIICLGASCDPSPTLAPTLSPYGLPVCASTGQDPYFDSSSPVCCSGLQPCLENWDGDGRYYERCFEDCSCASEGYNPYRYKSTGGRCCSGLTPCLADWDANDGVNMYYLCFPSCLPETTTSTALPPTQSPTPRHCSLGKGSSSDGCDCVLDKDCQSGKCGGIFPFRKCDGPVPLTPAPTPRPTPGWTPHGCLFPPRADGCHCVFDFDCESKKCTGLVFKKCRGHAPTEAPSVGPTEPTPSPAPCTALGSDPYWTGAFLECCTGLTLCMGHFDTPERDSYVCGFNCEASGRYNPHFDTTPDYLDITSRVKGINRQGGSLSDNFYIVVGDQGGCGGCSACCKMQYAVADLMKAYVRNRKKDNPNSELLFVLGVGDNFYWTGAKPGSFNTTWAEPYGPELTDVPWFMVMGNHDYGNNDPGAACPMTDPRFICNATNEKTPACGGNRPYTTESQEYDSNQLNADKGGVDGDIRKNYHMPDFTYYYTIPALDLEILAMDYNIADFHGLGGNGATPRGGASSTYFRCGHEYKVREFLTTVSDASKDILINRSSAGEHNNVAIIGHYPPWFQWDVNFRKQYQSNLPAAKKDSANIFNFYGHTHVQECNGYDVKGRCVDFLTGGSGGCCEVSDTPAGFVVVSFDSDGKQQTECFNPDGRCTLQRFNAETVTAATVPSYAEDFAKESTFEEIVELGAEKLNAWLRRHRERDVCNKTTDHPKCNSYLPPKYLVSNAGPQCKLQTCYVKEKHVKVNCLRENVSRAMQHMSKPFHYGNISDFLFDHVHRRDL